MHFIQIYADKNFKYGKKNFYIQLKKRKLLSLGSDTRKEMTEHCDLFFFCYKLCLYNSKAFVYNFKCVKYINEKYREKNFKNEITIT